MFNIKSYYRALTFDRGELVCDVELVRFNTGDVIGVAPSPTLDSISGAVRSGETSGVVELAEGLLVHWGLVRVDAQCGI